MTEPMSEPVAVEQVDRDGAAKYYGENSPTVWPINSRLEICAGNDDGNALVQAFARHRLTATPPAPESRVPTDHAGLLPCPFCGCAGSLVTNPHADMSWVACPACGLEAPSETGVSADDAVTYWNTRATFDQAVPSGVDGLVSELLDRVKNGGPHEWGYRDLTDGSFIADDWPFRAAEVLAALSPVPASAYQAVREAQKRISEGRRLKPFHADDPSCLCHACAEAPGNLREIAREALTKSPPQ